MDLNGLEAATYSVIECGSEEGSKMEREGSKRKEWRLESPFSGSAVDGVTVAVLWNIAEAEVTDFLFSIKAEVTVLVDHQEVGVTALWINGGWSHRFVDQQKVGVTVLWINGGWSHFG
jgi:hypothetical protein